MCSLEIVNQKRRKDLGEPNREESMKMPGGGKEFYIIEISKKPASQLSKGEKSKDQVMQHNRQSESKVLKLESVMY